jgi:hypothetical protein
MGTKNQPGDFDWYAAAEPDEPMFVLLARDRAAPDVVRAWAHWREARLRANAGNATALEVIEEFDQIAEARACADEMEAWREEHRP